MTVRQRNVLSQSQEDYLKALYELGARAHGPVGTNQLSERLGAVVVALALEEGAVVRFLLFDRGRMVDEYLSVPAYYGPLPRVDEIALAANPTLVARLTGADPARVRAVARTAGSLAELPPAPELLAQIAEVLGLAGAEHGFSAQ